MDGGYEVTLFGRGFRGNEEVRFAGVAASQVRFVSSAEAKLVVPAGAAPGRVEVEVVGNGEALSVEGGFLYTEPDTSPDISLEPEALKKDGRRVLYFKDAPVRLRAAYYKQVLCFFFSDLNGDGLDDLFLGEPSGVLDEVSGDIASRISIIFGRRDRPFPETIGPGETGDWGTVIEADPAHAQNLGAFMAFPGDLDGDGFRDLVLGPYLLFGRKEWPPHMFLRDELREKRAMMIQQDPCFNSAVAAPGDLDGNGKPDLLMTYSGCSYGDGKVRLFLDGLKRGQSLPPQSVEIRGDPTPIQFPLSAGSARPRKFGSALSAGGDLNGDGWPDLIVGADHAAPAGYLFLGGPIDWLGADILEIQDAGRAVKVHHDEMFLSFLDQFVGNLGDFNGDGIDDAALGARGGGRDFQGASYVLFGSRELGKSVKEIGLLTADPEKVLAILGEDPYDWSGSVQPLGDLDGDDLADLGITGEYHRHQFSRAYVVLGNSKPESPILLDRLGNRGFRIIGGDKRVFSGWIGGMAGGDLDGDGYKDIAMGFASLDEAGDWRKQAVVIFGRPSGGGRFIRGDANGDRQVDISDAISILSYLFTGGAEISCQDAADVDDDGELFLTDAINLLSHLYLGGPSPPAPYPGEGMDRTDDQLRPCTR
jgi:hypothetical protein